MLRPGWLVPPELHPGSDKIVMATEHSHGAEGEISLSLPLVDLSEPHDLRQRLCLHPGFRLAQGDAEAYNRAESGCNSTGEAARLPASVGQLLEHARYLRIYAGMLAQLRVLR